ncbi:competence/damage-inducible protein A [Cyclobacterium jeungdonense]|uniref:CinA-like protein n=1 Tax=Cyclobacterium jeungdonense TaxID=708087 RepID=A0ABT8C984_9BACT|nr:competence/damage-inducible protein A [Cyclobacterium jeungdonense]MDN3688383.1 competence/damage-inducible protein A [Cyclobacterium jeungdonense]
MQQPVTAEIISIGDELLYGQIMDTNSKWLSEEMDKIGVRVVRKTTIGDDHQSMLGAFEAAAITADIILITGGLGPTKDDLTKSVLADYFGSSLELFPDALEDVRNLFHSRGKELTATNRSQAYLPSNCKYIRNEVGTAPGMWFEEKGKIFMSMPGVPHEMKYLMEEEVIPRLKKKYQLPVIYHKLVRTVGIGESWLSDLISDWEEKLPAHIRLAYLPSLGEVKLRLTAFGTHQELLAAEVETHIERLLPLISKYVYGFNDDILPTAIGHLLVKHGKTLALAESCTGGYISHLITSIPGSSDYFNGGIIPYHNEFKEAVLGVSAEVLTSNGAVSEATVTEMARHARNKFHSDFGLASSGIAGPGGGTKEKPVGLVWIACDDGQACHTRKLQLTKDRTVNIHLTAIAALNLLRETILRATT